MKITTTNGKVVVYKSGKVKITFKITKPNGKIENRTMKLEPEDIDFDVTDIDELAKRYM